MEEPQQLASALTEFVARHPAGSRLHTIGAGMLAAHQANQARRAAVLRHPDLARKLTQFPLAWKRPQNWNGYIPPMDWPVDCDCWPDCTGMDGHGGEAVRASKIGQNGQLSVRFGQLGHRSGGTRPNSSAVRDALLEISAEAWRRENGIPPAE